MQQVTRDVGPLDPLTLKQQQQQLQPAAAGAAATGETAGYTPGE